MFRRPWLMSVSVFAGLFIIHQAMAFRPSVIYGEDDRLDYYQVNDPSIRSLADSTVALVRAANLETSGDKTLLKTTSYGQSMGLCPTEPFYNQETLAFCSGSLIASDIILTAGHCVRSQESCNSTRFLFGFKLSDSISLPKELPNDHIYSCKQVIYTVADPNGEDFALVRLDRSVTGARPLTYRREGRLNPGDSLRVIGHPAGLPVKVAGNATVRVMKDQFLVANLDTYGGNSGSAVLNSHNGQVEGILVRGELDYVYQNNCRVSNRCPIEGCRGEDVTLIERVAPLLQSLTGN